MLESSGSLAADWRAGSVKSITALPVLAALFRLGCGPGLTLLVSRRCGYGTVRSTKDLVLAQRWVYLAALPVLARLFRLGLCPGWNRYCSSRWCWNRCLKWQRCCTQRSSGWGSCVPVFWQTPAGIGLVSWKIPGVPGAAWCWLLGMAALLPQSAWSGWQSVFRLA